MRALLCAVILGLAAAAPSEEKGRYEAFMAPIDLTHPLGVHAQNWPGARTFEFTQMVAESKPDFGGWVAFNEFCMAEHLGTHLDAPYHFNETGWKVGDIPLKHLIAPGILIDASEAAAANRDLFLGADALQTWEAKHGRVPVGSVVLLRFGWAHKYNNRKEYFGMETDDRNTNSFDAKLSFPALSKELAEALAERKVAGVGLDTPSVDPGKAGDHDAHAHRALAAVNAYNLENVDLTTTLLPPKGFTVIVMPAKIRRGTGAPVRIVAVPGDLTANWAF